MFTSYTVHTVLGTANTETKFIVSRTGDGSIQNLKYDVRIGSDFGSCFGF